jgi:hypothetical protein
MTRATRVASFLRHFPAPPGHVPVERLENLMSFITDTLGEVEEGSWVSAWTKTIREMLKNAMDDAKHKAGV